MTEEHDLANKPEAAAEQVEEAVDYQAAPPPAQKLEEGQILEAKVILVRDDLVFVDLGGKSDLTISLEELSATPPASAKELVREGEIIKVMVTKSGGDEERIGLSRRLVEQEQAWLDLEAAQQSGQPLPAEGVAVVKGGLEVKLGEVKAFMPGSQATLGSSQDLAALVGQSFPVKVLEFERAGRRVVVSRRELLLAEKEKAEAEVFATLKEGDRRSGKVTRTTDFGAFVDLGSGVEGLIHISELSWNRVKTATEAVHEGDAVETLVIKVDPQARRISLSLKQLQKHPWDEASLQFREDEVYPGTVVRMESFGAFIRLAPGIDGLAHVSQIADHRISKPDEVLKLGQEVSAKIIKIDPGQRRISLSLNAVAQDQESQVVKDYIKGQDQGSFGQSLGDFFGKIVINQTVESSKKTVPPAGSKQQAAGKRPQQTQESKASSQETVAKKEAVTAKAKKQAASEKPPVKVTKKPVAAVKKAAVKKPAAKATAAKKSKTAPAGAE